MATLADELLNDFEDSGSENGLEDGFQDDGRDGPQEETDNANEGGMMLDGDDEDTGDVDEEAQYKAEHGDLAGADEDTAKARVEKMQLANVGDVRSVALLMKKLSPVLEKIKHYKSLPAEQRTTHIGALEDNPEYHLLTESNSLSTAIDSEIILVHKFIRDHYSTRFPELETLISNPLDYAKTVAILGNGPMDDIKSLASSSDNIVGQTLRSILDGPSLMVVTVEGTTTRGRELNDRELQIVMSACQMQLDLDNAKKVLTEYVQSRMNVFAPNLTALIGSLTAAQLLNFAGGIQGLAKVPACNIAAVGSRKQAQSGMATNVGGPRQQGFLFQSELIQEIPADLRKQALRIVSAKLVLAARVDSVHSSPDGSTGEQLKQDCLTRLDKLTEAAPNKGARALPAPDDKPARKRGGRRARKAKEATAMTDLRQAQNRMAFGKEEKEVGYGTGDGTKGLGMIGASNDGRIRATQVDQRTRAKLSKNNKGWGTATPIGGTATSLRGFGSAGNATTLAPGLRSMGVNSLAGTASSIAFTPVQGLELVDPKISAELSRKRKAEEDRWFKGGTFTQIGGSGSGPGAASKDGFKVPQLPINKKVDTGKGKMGPPAPK